MGSDTLAFLPPETRADKIALVLEALTGHPLQREPLRGWEDTNSTVALGHNVVKIDAWDHSFGSGSLDSPELPWTTIHLQSRDPLGRQAVRLSTASYEVGTRLLTAVTKFFGGVLVLDDCAGWEGEESKGNVMLFARPRPSNDPEDGDEWQAFQDALLAVEAIEPWRRKPEPKGKAKSGPGSGSRRAFGYGGSEIFDWPQPASPSGPNGELCPQLAHEVARLLGLILHRSRSVTRARAWCGPNEQIIGSFRAPVTAGFGEIERIADTATKERPTRFEQVAKGRPSEESEDWRDDGDLYVVYGKR